MVEQTLQVDVVVVGGGIAGMQAALDLGNQGYRVALVERDASIGGKMIALSKVFPTLDCCSCITTPKMSAVAHHANIELLTYTEVKSIQQHDGRYLIHGVEKPRYVDVDLCTGCRQCEYACPIDLPDPFQMGLSAHRAIRVPFSTAVPQKAVLDMQHCILCGKCEKACPVEAIDFTQGPRELHVETTAIVLTTGFEITPPGAKAEYGAGKLPNVIDALTMERLLAPTGPYLHVLRPSDGKEPDSIAYVQCAGSRDETLGVPYCSRVCCMYAIKQAQLLAGALPMVDITIYYMDIRAFGKGYEQFYRSAETMGVEFVKGKVAKITEEENRDLRLRVEMVDATPRILERTHDLVVLSVGMLPAYQPLDCFGVPASADGFIAAPSPNMAPAMTQRPGIFAAGTALGPMDIVDSIVMAGAAATEAAAFLEGSNGRPPAQIEPSMAAGEREVTHV